MLLPLKRALRLTAVLTGWLLFDLGFAFIVISREDSGLLVPGGAAESILSTTFVATNLLFPAFLIYWRHKRRAEWIKEEANAWLANRRKETLTIAKRNRAIQHGLLWLPSLLALTVFLFLPEAMGLVSHLLSGASVSLNNHRITPPITSFIEAWRLPTRKYLYLGVLVGKGIGQVGCAPYWRKGPPLSSMFFYALPDPTDHSHDDFLVHDTILSKRTTAFGDETLTCWEINQKRHEYEPVVSVECRTSRNDVSAGYYGLREDLPTFYSVLSHVTEDK